jgi:electron transport complex protein RnfC
MFGLKIKKQEVLDLINKEKFFVIVCEGCNEVSFIRDEILSFVKSLPKENILYFEVVDYLCNPDFVNLYLKTFDKKIKVADSILVFSCGIGVSTIAKSINKKVYTGCDTFYITGYKGANVPYNGKFDCALCGECYLNYTANICPITSCLKSLLNGPCGGAKNGKCEVDREKDCGWEKIFERLKQFGKLAEIKEKVFIRNYGK